MIYHQSHVYMKVYRTRGVIYNILSLDKDARFAGITKSAMIRFWFDLIQEPEIDIRQYHMPI